MSILKNNKIEYLNTTLYEVIKKSALDYPNNIAYTYYKKRCNYKTFLKRIDYCAQAFVASGIKCGDVITICMPNTPEAIIAFYALNKIGAVANMIHPLSSENEIKYCLNLSNSVMVITINEVLDKVETIVSETSVKKIIVAPINYSMKLLEGTLYYVVKGRKYNSNKKLENIVYWGEFIKRGVGYISDVRIVGDGNNTCCVLYSSGTTGNAKGIVLNNNNFNALVAQTHDSRPYITSDDSVLSIMPIFHGFGLGICIHYFLAIGATVTLVPQFNAKKFDRLLKKNKPNVIVGVPTLYEALVNKKSRIDLSYVKLVISGGDSLSIGLKQQVDEYLRDHNCSTNLIEGYGLTECVSACCLTPDNSSKVGSIGIPFKGTTFKIVDINTQKEVKTKEMGEICISGPTVMQGYLNDPDATNDVLKKVKDKVWLHTGDLGYMDKDGYVYFVQRLKRMIISSGYNIYPAQVEKAINENEYVLTSTVVGVPHPYKMQVAKAYIVLKDNVEPTLKVKNSIKETLEQGVAKYAIPKEIEYIKSLPKTKMGKVDYKVLEK